MSFAACGGCVRGQVQLANGEAWKVVVGQCGKATVTSCVTSRRRYELCCHSAQPSCVERVDTFVMEPIVCAFSVDAVNLSYAVVVLDGSSASHECTCTIFGVVYCTGMPLSI